MNEKKEPKRASKIVVCDYFLFCIFLSILLLASTIIYWLKRRAAWHGASRSSKRMNDKLVLWKGIVQSFPYEYSSCCRIQFLQITFDVQCHQQCVVCTDSLHCHIAQHCLKLYQFLKGSLKPEVATVSHSSHSIINMVI